MERKPRILIVDDDASARETMLALLAMEGYELGCAGAAAEAFARLEEDPPDVILLDVMMPGVDGFAVCRTIKGDSRFRHIPVLFVTALDRKEDLARGLAAGGDDFLAKPVNSIELRARVRSMLRIKHQHDQLAAALAVREELAAMIVHDMRSPLNVVMGYSEMALRKTDLSPYCIEILTKIKLQSERMNDFLNDMLLLAKMEGGKLQLNRAPVDVNQVLAQAVADHRPTAEARGVTLNESPAAATASASIDASLFRRVLDNLLSNAIKFSSAGGSVRAQVSPLPGNGSGQVRVSVADEGPGIAEDQRERVFDKFEIGSLRRSGVSQVGLGLAFAKLAVETHGGRIAVQPNSPCGSIFTVDI